MTAATTTITTKAPTLAALIETRQTRFRITDAEISQALGYAHEQVITLIKQRKMNLPINKVSALANALSVDAIDVLRLAMAETAPELLSVIESVLNPMSLTTSEANLIRHCRKLAKGRESGSLVIDGKDVIALITI